MADRLTDVILRVMEDREFSMRTHAERRYWTNQIRLAVEQATTVALLEKP